MFREWLISRRAAKEARQRNYEFLQRVADAVLDEYESLAYATLIEREKLITGVEAIVNGVWIDWHSEFKRSPDGAITIAVILHSKLPTPSRGTPSRSIVKRPDDAGTPRETFYWVRPIPTVHIDGVQPIEVPVGTAKAALVAARRQNSQFLESVADAIEDEYKSLPYALLADIERLPGFPEVIANGAPVSWNFEFQGLRNGGIGVQLDFHSDLPTKCGKPSRYFEKQPGDPGTPREALRWIQLNPIVEIEGVEITPPT